jgi:hypothetical protein
MQLTRQTEWELTVPFFTPVDDTFNFFEYFSDFTIDKSIKEDIAKVLKISNVFKLCNGKTFYAIQLAYRRLLENIVDADIEYDDDIDVNDKVFDIGWGYVDESWRLLAVYKEFEIFESIDAETIYISHPDRPCFQNHNGFARFMLTIPPCDRDELAVSEAKQLIDAWELSGRAIGQLSLPI